LAAEGDIDIRLLKHYFAQRPCGRKRVLVEVGAASPEYLSIGARFRAAGWRVLSVEPNPVFAAQHRRVGNEIYEFAAADNDEDAVDFVMVNLHGAKYESGEITYESISSLGIKSEFEQQLKELSDTASLEKIAVKVRRLDTILSIAPERVDQIDLLCVDVEGWEMEVLDGLNFEVNSPNVIVLENFASRRDYHERLNSLGYKFIERISLNEIYVRSTA
jgi:FkbM family methyltransferase